MKCRTIYLTLTGQRQSGIISIFDAKNKPDIHMLTFNECQELIQRHTERLDLPEVPAQLYEPIRYMLEPSGKRIRPSMVLMACNVFTEDVDDALYAAMAVEVFHNFTLMHDDIMDQSVLRRNKPAVHIRWNPNVAILSGDAMVIRAYELVARTPEDRLPAMLSLFNRTAREVCEGQQYDMDFEHITDINLEQYLMMIRLKTAVLLAASLKMGAIAGCACEADAECLYRFGIGLGMAFQLRDDLLDVYADQNAFGKVTGNDIMANKKTVLLVQALTAAEGPEREALLQWLGNTEAPREEKIAGVRQIYDRLGLSEKTRELIRTYHEQALAELDTLSVPADRTQPLRALSGLLMDRKK
jgi:geranylgeranyl diphosphate synthase, type II